MGESITFVKKKKSQLDDIDVKTPEEKPDETLLFKQKYIEFLEGIYDDVLRAHQG